MRSFFYCKRPERQGAKRWKMEKLKKEIYSAIGLTFYAFLTGKPYNMDMLKQFIPTLNALQLQGQIDSNIYDYYMDVLEGTIEFFEP